jgi:guanine nucleotide-binding protein G(i) subunit alpha
MEHQTEFYLMDSAEYFFQEAMRIVAPDYLPTEMDVLRARTKTTGIYETRFQMGQLSIHMFDVGGQRSERKKWIHCFENVTSIIFCVALSEYDQVLLEESSQNRMMESLLLFDSVVNSRWFMRTSIILFLNKVDIFKQKLSRSPLGNYFPDYSGGNDVNKAAKYLLWRFNQVNRAHLNLYPHLTQATDTSNIRLVFAAVKETILNNALKDSGIL